MTEALARLPLFVVMMGIASAAMLAPGLLALGTGDGRSATAFLGSAGLSAILTALIGAATRGQPPRNPARSQLLTLVAAFAALPVLLAVPFLAALPTTTPFNAWFEMVSSITTTGATLYAPERLPEAVHLWRALVGWLGGFLVIVAAVAILAPMNLGGFEVTSAAAVGAGARITRAGARRDAEDARARLLRHTGELAPVYAGLTAALTVGLLILGEAPLVAICHAMSTLATSGISPVGPGATLTSGIPGEALIFVFFVFGITRASFAGGMGKTQSDRFAQDPEARLGGALVIVVPTILFLRHWIGAFEVDMVEDLGSALSALWGSIFTVLSFLSTTGFVSADWETARSWSGIATPGMVLLGLALFGGGVATTAGGVKLMRVYALYKHGERELGRLVHPSSVSGGGPEARRIRGKGAEISWIFFMLFALAIALVSCALAAEGAPFDAALVLTVAALANCGPVADAVQATPIGFVDLGVFGKAVTAAAMVLGRMETLALIALLNPGFWRV